MKIRRNSRIIRRDSRINRRDSRIIRRNSRIIRRDSRIIKQFNGKPKGFNDLPKELLLILHCRHCLAPLININFKSQTLLKSPQWPRIKFGLVCFLKLFITSNLQTSGILKVYMNVDF